MTTTTTATTAATTTNTVSITLIKTLVENMSALNIPALDFCKQLDIDTTRFDDLQGRVPEAKFYYLMSMARKFSDDPALALKLGNCSIPTLYGPFGYYIMSAKNLAEISTRIDKYRKFLSDGYDIAEVMDDEHYHMQVILAESETNETVEFIQEFLVTNAWKFMEWVYASPNNKPVEVQFTRSAPEDTKTYENYFGCPVLFEQEHNAVVMTKGSFQFRNPTYNKEMEALHEQEVQTLAADTDAQTITGLVRDQIIELLPAGEASMQVISRHFNISERTLLRRLKTEGWTFLDLVDDTRKSMAKYYIEKTESSFQEITFLLGFKDSSTFYRAFKRWYGKTPSQFRQLLPKPVMSVLGNQLEPRTRM